MSYSPKTETLQSPPKFMLALGRFITIAFSISVLASIIIAFLVAMEVVAFKSISNIFVIP